MRDLLALGFLFTFCAAPPCVVMAENAEKQTRSQIATKIAGTWETSQGLLMLSARRDGLTGDLIADGGRVFGKVDDSGTFSGVWVKDSGAEACSTKVDGSPHWGKFKLGLSKDGRALSGVLAHCDGELTPQSTPWTGTRIPD